MSYKVYLYNIPKVSEDGKQSIAVPDSQVKEFNGGGAMRRCLMLNIGTTLTVLY
jgi:hypothetical protein